MNKEALAAFGVGLRFGVICAVRYNPPMYKVTLPDADEMETPWLLCLTSRSKQDKTHAALEVGEQVALLLDSIAESGVILGAVFSDADIAPAGTWVMQFEDGTCIKYDKEAHVLTASGDMDVVITTSKTAKIQAQTCTLLAEDIILNASNIKSLGNWLHMGDFKALGNVSDVMGSMLKMRIAYNGHTNAPPTAFAIKPSDIMN